MEICNFDLSYIILIFTFRAPFTVQRLCELINEPKRHYKRCDKFLRGIEKVRHLSSPGSKHLLVTSIPHPLYQTCFQNKLFNYNSTDE